jgi:hypothetical protein
MTKATTKVVHVRLPIEQVAALDAICAKSCEEVPGSTMSRNECVRIAVARWLQPIAERAS